MDKVNNLQGDCLRRLRRPHRSVGLVWLGGVCLGLLYGH